MREVLQHAGILPTFNTPLSSLPMFSTIMERMDPKRIYIFSFSLAEDRIEEFQ